MFISSSLSFLKLDPFWHKLIEALIVFNFAWICIASLNALEEAVKYKFSIDRNHIAKDRKTPLIIGICAVKLGNNSLDSYKKTTLLLYKNRNKWKNIKYK
jgi:hypothetical protein